MREASYTPEEIGEALAGSRAADGTTVAQAHEMGFTPDEIHAAGYSDDEVVETVAGVREDGKDVRAAYDLGFRPPELVQAGYSPAEVSELLATLKAGPHAKKAPPWPWDSLQPPCHPCHPLATLATPLPPTQPAQTPVVAARGAPSCHRRHPRAAF